MSEENEDDQLSAFYVDKKIDRSPLVSKKNMIFVQRKSINKERTKIGNSLKTRV